MDGMILILVAALLLVQVPEPRQLPRLRFPRFSLIRFRQWRAVRRQRVRDRAFDEAMTRIEQNESDCVRAAVMSQLRNNELPKCEEAFHAGH